MTLGVELQYKIFCGGGVYGIQVSNRDAEFIYTDDLIIKLSNDYYILMQCIIN